jgi:predicted transposase YbfD/YdcC
LAHIVLENKESEIPALQNFLTQIEIKGKVITADAIHCQKKLLK